jgi:hypothetical protein
MTGIDTDDGDYISNLRAHIADPTQAVVFQCLKCGHRIAYRCWPADVGDTCESSAALDAFLDGLAALDACADWTVYGGWTLDRHDQFDPDPPCQVWAGRDRRLVSTRPHISAAVFDMTLHICTAAS